MAGNSGVIVHHNTHPYRARQMITLRKRMTGPRTGRMLLPALLFFVCASLSAAGGGAVAALCLVPAGLALDAARNADEATDGDEARDHA